MKLYQKIKINGFTYSPKTLQNLVKNRDDKYVQDIFTFLSEWFNSSKFINVQTSGSTGIPKTIQLFKKGMAHSAMLTQQYFGLNSNQTALLCLPVHYIAGKMMLVRAIVSGFNLILANPSSNPFLTIDETIDFTAITPYQLYHSLETLKHKKVKQIIVGGSAVSAKLEEDCQLLDTAIYETYGMTETSSHVALRKINGTNRTEFFKPLPGITLSVDQRNCLVIQAPDITDEIVVTNDIVEFKGNDFKWIGRYDRVINSGGIKIYPEQIEKKIEGLINRRFYITSTSHASLKEAACLVIEGDPFAENEIKHLQTELRKILEPYQIPKEILFKKELKTSLTGKVIKEI